MTDDELLLRIYDDGQSVHVEGNVDHRPYRRLEDLSLLEGRSLNLQAASYRLSPEGLKRALALKEAATPSS
jgi:hypothetical protein